MVSKNILHSFSIRKSEVGDIPAITEIARESRLSPWPTQDFANELKRDDSVVLSLTSNNGELAGFLTARVIPSPTQDGEVDTEIHNLAVKESLRHSGGAQMLMADFYARAKAAGVRNIWLDVRESNIDAIQFYKKQAFVEQGRRPRFYSDPPESGIIMKRLL